MRALLRRPAVQKAGWLLLFLLIWQAVACSGRVPPQLLPTLGQVAAAWWAAVTTGHLLWQVGFSLFVILAGLCISVFLALFLGFAALRFRVVASLADTLSALAHPLPAIALMPIIIVWFGIGTGAVTAIIVHAALWPILLNLRAGLAAVPAIYTETGRSLRLAPLAMAGHIYLPASAPYLLAGVKIGWARAWRALISAEMVFGAIGAYGGVGWFIHMGRVFMNTAALFAGVATIVAVGMAAEALLNAVEGKLNQTWGVT